MDENRQTSWRPKSGVELTDDVLDAILRRRRGRQAVEDRAAADGTTASDVVRTALRHYLKVS